jgi:hypothetical protein
MLKLIPVATALLLSYASHFKDSTAQKRSNAYIQSRTWQFKAQYFASHDRAGTDVDTIRGNGNDYLYFDKNGKAYSHFKGIFDTTEYKFIGNDSISFGDTPFQIINASLGQLELYQNEEETNGDYNRVYYILTEHKTTLQN